MDKGSDSSGGSSAGGLIMLLLAAVGLVFVATKPLESSRPALPEPKAERRQAAQDVDARLWQDPFGAIAKAREQAQKPKSDGTKSERELHDLESFAVELRQQVAAAGPAGHTVVLAVMLYGGPYAERVESRLRTRYAVLAGLSARGYVPIDSEHLGYFYPQPESERRELPETVPFETFERGLRWGERSTGECKDDCRVVVLWLDSTAFATQPLRKLARLAEDIQSKMPKATEAAPPVRWRVLGPSSSDGLRALVREAAADPEPARKLAAFDLRFFSGMATAPDNALLPPRETEHKTVSAFLASRSVPLLRTIGTDDQLARALVEELERRGLRQGPAKGEKADPCPDQEASVTERESQPERRSSSIAIVAEWDTLYGRTLREQFRYREATSDRSGQPGYCVTRWHYVRGLDGRLPGDAAPATDPRAKKDGRSEGADAIGREGSYFERPEGQSQFDYLRRLASRMREEDERLRRIHGPENGIRAIGVLGNDVYDKLLVLQTLHNELPHAIFFTTDLDARLFHPSEQAWARNLIVASNFGLRLNSPLQREFAPFRDSYQTSSYLSTVLAMADVRRAISGSGPGEALTQERIAAWFKQPRLFEVTRSGVFDFSAAPQAPDPRAKPPEGAASASEAPAPGGRRPPQCGRIAPELCKDAEIHAYVSPMTPDWSAGARFLIAGTLTLALWLPALALSRDRQRQLRRYVARGGDSPRRRALQAFKLAGGLAALVLVPPLLLSWAWPGLAGWITEQGNGKPLSFVDGISPWPTYAIRTATFVLCLYLVVRAWSSLATNIDQIAREFRLGATRRHFHALLAADHQHRTIWQRLAAMLTVAFYRERPGLLGSRAGMSAAAVTFWKHYIVQNRASARLLRTGLCMVLMIALSTLIANALGDPPLAPQRGELSATMQWITSLLPALAIQFLIFFVVDATVLCVFFMRGLRLHQANWPERTLQCFNSSTGVPVEYLDDWIDLQFIARRTQAIGALIYYPFVGLSLMLLARSSFFDDWYTPPTVFTLATLSVVIVLGCALALRRGAEASRQHALQRLRDAILRAKGAGNGILVGQLETMRDRIERLTDGAFAPYSRQPLLKAVLLPVLTYGGSSLFDYLAMLNL